MGIKNLIIITKMKNISPHITYAEAIKSQTAVKYAKENIPNEKQIETMCLVANKVFEPVRKHFGIPIAITSFFRSKQLNVLIGGSHNSQHCKGEAMDLDADVYGQINNSDIFLYIKNNLLFDQLIWEYGNDSQPDWVHVSYRKDNNRKQLLRSKKDGYNTVYERWIG